MALITVFFSQDLYEEDMKAQSIIRIVLKFLVYILLIYFTFIEYLQVKDKGLSYLRQVYNWVDILSVTFNSTILLKS